MRSFNIVFSITTGASPSHTHASVISGKMLWGAARQCGIVPQDLWLGFNKWPFYQICFAFGWWICPNTTSLGHLGTPALRWLFCHVSKISVHFFPAVIGTILAGFCRWNVVVGSCRGRDVCRVPVSDCDLWQRKFYSWICLSTGWFLLQLSMRWRNTAKTQRKGYCVAGRMKEKRSSKDTRTFLRQHITGLHGIFFRKPGCPPWCLTLCVTWSGTQIMFSHLLIKCN